MFELRTLGEVRLYGPGGELLARRRKELALLAVLAARSPRAVRRAELAELFWGDRDEGRARHSLRQSLLTLRRAIGEGLAVESDTVTLSRDVVVLDLAAFHAALDEGRPADAVLLWRGDFLPDTEDVGGESFRVWLESARENARRRLASALQQLVAAAADPAEQLRLLEKWTELLPLDESAHAQLITALHAAGRAGEALSRHAEYCARLSREYEVRPSEEFLRLPDRLAAHSPPSAGATPSAAIFTPDLIAREAHLAELTAAWRSVRDGGSEVVLVEGSEGLGKTALCQRFLRSLETEPGTALLLEARTDAGVTTRDLVIPLISARGLSGVDDRELAELAVILPELRERWPGLPQATGDEGAFHRAAANVIAAVAHEQPVIVVIDGLADADGTMRHVAIDLARRRPPHVLLLLTDDGDAGTVTELRRLSGLRRLRLQPLDRDQIEALIGSMLELPAPQRQRLANRLHAETGGNPFHAAEIVNLMVDDGLLTLDPQGVWQLTAAEEGPLPLPSGVRDAVQRRIDALDADARAVVFAAATVTGPIEPATLARRMGLERARVDNALHELLSRRLFRTDATGAFDFAHNAMRRAAAESVPPSPVVRRVRSRRAALLSTGAVAALVVAAVLMLRSAAASPTVAAVAHIETRAAVATQDEADAVAAMLATSLSQLGELHVIGRERLYELVGGAGATGPPRAALIAAARRGGADEIIVGELEAEPGGGFRLTLRWSDDGRRNREAVSVADSALPGLVDAAAAAVARRLGTGAPRRTIGDIGSASLPAWMSYDAGLRRYARGNWPDARAEFERALRADPQFAMAAYYAARSGTDLGTAAMRRLLGLAARATERDRLLIRLWVAAQTNDPVGVAVAESLVARVPYESDPHLLLGRARTTAGEFMAAVAPLQRAIAMDSALIMPADTVCGRICDAFNSLAAAYSASDSFAAVERVARDWIRLRPASPQSWLWLHSTLNAQGRFDEADATLVSANAAAGPALSAFDPFALPSSRILTGNLRAADENIVALLHAGADSTAGLWYLTISLRAQGRLREALVQNERHEEILRQRQVERGGPMLQRAQIMFELGRFQESALVFDSLAADPYTGISDGWLARNKSWMLVHLASARAAEGDTAALKTLLEPLRAWGLRSGYGRDRRLHHHVRGLLLVARGQDSAAVAEFRAAMFSPTIGYTRTNYELGRTLLRLGQAREAIAVLQPALRGALDGSNLYVTRTELHELLGYAFEAAGEPDSAAAHFELVLDAWRDADPELHARRSSVAERAAALRQRNR